MVIALFSGVSSTVHGVLPPPLSLPLSVGTTRLMHTATVVAGGWDAAQTDDLVLVSRHGYVRTNVEELRMLLAAAAHAAAQASALGAGVDAAAVTAEFQAILRASAPPSGPAGTARPPARPPAIASAAPARAGGAEEAAREGDKDEDDPPAARGEVTAATTVATVAEREEEEKGADDADEDTRPPTPEAAVGGEPPASGTAAPKRRGLRAPAVAAPARRGLEAELDTRSGRVSYVEYVCLAAHAHPHTAAQQPKGACARRDSFLKIDACVCVQQPGGGRGRGCHAECAHAARDGPCGARGQPRTRGARLGGGGRVCAARRLDGQGGRPHGCTPCDRSPHGCLEGGQARRSA
jgi:hypothetical protein